MHTLRTYWVIPTSTHEKSSLACIVHASILANILAAGCPGADLLFFDAVVCLEDVVCLEAVADTDVVCLEEADLVRLVICLEEADLLQADEGL